MNYDFDSAKSLLARTPSTLDSWLRALPEEWLRLNEGDLTWSAYDILGHFIHGEKTDWVPRARIILTRAESVGFPPFDRFAQFAEGSDASMTERLDEFARLRQANLETLDALRITPEQMAWTGVHPEFGQVTLRQLLATWIVHDQSHLGQIARVLAKGYASEVGPWRAYIPILGR